MRLSFSRIGSIRMRITILSGAIIIATLVLLTVTSSYNAKTRFVDPLVTGTISIKGGGSSSEVTSPISGGTSAAITAPAQSSGGQHPEFETISVRQAKQQFDIWSYVYLILISVIGMIAVYIASGKALKPLRNLNNAVTHITEHNFEKHLPASTFNDEIGSLTRSFNSMLDRLEQSFLRQKRFSANVAHELKTPLATIQAGIQVLEIDEKPKIADYKETLFIIQRNIKRLIHVVNDLLSLSNESLVVHKDEIHFKHMFKQIVSELQSFYIRKNIEIVCDVSLDTMKGNTTLVHRAFYNLVENAIKYNRVDGKIVIHAFSEAGIKKICISDTGIGIPNEDIERIFEPFYCVDPSRSRKFGGSGLGLAIVKAIFEKHGWSIAITSEMDKGTTITVLLS